MGPRGKELLAVVEFGSRPQGRLLIPHRQFINNTLVRVCIGMRSFPFTLILNSPPPLSPYTPTTNVAIRAQSIHPSIHRQAGTTLGVIPELSRAISFFTFGQATNTDRMQDRCALPVV